MCSEQQMSDSGHLTDLDQVFEQVLGDPVPDYEPVRDLVAFVWYLLRRDEK